ncbi:MAG: acetoacetate decarboxylase family protein [Pseudomonadota bacterium]
MTDALFPGSFSMPYGSSLYGRPPYIYRGVEDMVVAYEADAERLKPLLPPGVTVAGQVAECLAWTRWIPFSSFGPYHEAYAMVRAQFDGETYLYNPFMIVDNEVALAVGREVWGYPKKLGTFTRGWGNSGAGFGEQLLCKVERPLNHTLMSASMACAERADPEELDADYPILSLRIIPDGEDLSRPSIAQLVALELPVSVKTGSDGAAEFYKGPAQLRFESSASDPWGLAAPVNITGGFFGVFDFDLVPGRVVHDYLS